MVGAAGCTVCPSRPLETSWRGLAMIQVSRLLTKLLTEGAVTITDALPHFIPSLSRLFQSGNLQTLLSAIPLLPLPDREQPGDCGL